MELRNYLRRHLPIHYIPPLSEKEISFRFKNEVLKQRCDEISIFLLYLIEDNKFCLFDGFVRFFDSNIKDTLIGN